MTKSLAEEIIEQKGVSLIAERLGERPETVRIWKHRKRFPRAKWFDLVEAFPDVTLDMLRADDRERAAA